MNEENHPNYYAVIPADVRYNKSLSSSAKLLYGEIAALCNKKGFCWASNKYFAEMYGVSKNSITTWISTLQAQGHIWIETEEGHWRHIYIKKQGHPENLVGGHPENLVGAPRKLGV